MAVKDFKKFFKRRERFVRQPRNDKKKFQRSRDEKNDKSDRKCFRCGDPNHLIRECLKPPKENNQRAFDGVNLELDEWIKDSGCSKHMTGNQKLFFTYKAYNGGNVIFGSNLRCNITCKGQICDSKCKVIFYKNDNEIVKEGEVIEPKNVNKALKDESWIIAMQEELNQFVANDVWELVRQPKNRKIIGTKCVYRNKLDENGVVSRNKDRLVAQDTKLTKDEECESVDSTKYRGMIGSLLYLTASRPDIMFSICLCARFQEYPKTSHLEAVKRIF
ncbi:retrovirus-related pol polyprotein from transposon TNT 1-94 [Tanacetum coccineum]